MSSQIEKYEFGLYHGWREYDSFYKGVMYYSNFTTKSKFRKKLRCRIIQGDSKIEWRVLK